VWPQHVSSVRPQKADLCGHADLPSQPSSSRSARSLAWPSTPARQLRCNWACVPALAHCAARTAPASRAAPHFSPLARPRTPDHSHRSPSLRGPAWKPSPPATGSTASTRPRRSSAKTAWVTAAARSSMIPSPSMRRRAPSFCTRILRSAHGSAAGADDAPARDPTPCEDARDVVLRCLDRRRRLSVRKDRRAAHRTV
jgi:hypothetical protein